MSEDELRNKISDTLEKARLHICRLLTKASLPTSLASHISVVHNDPLGRWKRVDKTISIGSLQNPSIAKQISPTKLPFDLVLHDFMLPQRESY